MNLLHLAELTWTKARLNLRSEARSNYLSYFWWILEPALQILAYYIVFGILLGSARLAGRGGEGYLALLLCGAIPWSWFTKAVSHATSSILGGGWVILNIPITKVFFPLAVFIQDSVKGIFIIAMLLITLLLLGYGLNQNWLFIPVVVLVQLLFTLCICMLVSAITPFLPDIKHLVPIGLQMMMFASGVFYSPEIIPEHLREWFFYNPMACLIEAYREILIGSGVSVTTQTRLFLISILSIAGIIGLYWFIRNNDAEYPKLAA